jgi:copper resistance protein C
VKGFPGALLLLAILLGAPSGARAHAFLERAAPAVGSRVHGAPGEVRLRFNEALEPDGSSIQVVGAGGGRVDAGGARRNVGDAREVFVPLRAAPAGVYRVFWRAVSGDGHVTEGDFTFEVVP